MAQLTDEQIAAGREVKRTLRAVERAQRHLHNALAALVAAFGGNLAPELMAEFGGGTPKDPPPDGDGS